MAPCCAGAAPRGRHCVRLATGSLPLEGGVAEEPEADWLQALRVALTPDGSGKRSSEHYGLAEHSNAQRSTMSASECNSRLISADLEYKLAGLVSARLRAERRRRPKLNLRFKLASNFAERDPVSELALTVKWLEDGKRRRLTYFVQLKPTSSTTKPVTVRELQAEDGNFSLVKCYQQYKNLRAQMQAAHNGSVKRKRFCSSLLDDCRFVIFSSREVFRGRLSSKASSALLFPFEDVFSTGVGEVFSFGERDEEVWSLLDGEDKAIFRKEFLPRLRIFCGQAPASALDPLLTKALADAVGSPLPREQAVVERLNTALRLWWQRADGRALSECSHEIDEALREDIMATADTRRFDFHEQSCHELSEVLRVNRCVYLTVPGVSCNVRCSKIRKVLEENLKLISKFSRRFIILSESTFHEYHHEVLESLCADFCGVLVVDLDNYSDKILNFLLRVIDEVQKLVVLSSSFIPKIQNFFRKHGRLYKEYEDTWTLEQLSATQQEQLLRRRVVFQGYEMSLGELEGAWPSLRAVVGGATLEALEGSRQVMLGAPLPSEHPNYVPRKLQHRSQLRGDVFDHRDGRDYFLLTGFPEGVLQRLRSPTSGWEERELMEVGTTEEQPTPSKIMPRQGSIGKTKWCVWEKVSPPDRLAEKLRENVHWLAFEGSTIIWKHTYGDSQVLGKYVDRQSLNCQNTYVCSHNDMDDFLNWNNPTILLAGDVGIGKSAFMIRMANRIKQGRKTHWVVLLTINQGQVLESLPSHIKLDDVVYLLEKSTQNEDCTQNKLTRHFLKDCLEKSGSIAVLVDVVAEICPMHMAKVQRILTLIQESRGQYLCVAATTSSDSALKNVLKCSPSTLQPFSSENQQRYLLAQWSEGMNTIERANLQKGVQKLVEIVGEVTDYEGRRICEVPLYTRMLAVAYNGEERTTLLRNCEAGVDLKMSALTLYRKFVQEARKSFRRKRKMDEKTSTLQKEDFINKLKSYAAYLCFSDRKLLGEFYEECKKAGCELKTLEFDASAGLLRKRATGHVGFMHHTFREYFAALWCADRFQQLPHLVRVLYTPRGARVRGFFDALLAEGHALHEAALSGRCGAVEAALAHGHQVERRRTGGGRRALHWPAAYRPPARRARAAGGRRVEARATTCAAARRAAVTPTNAAAGRGRARLLEAGADRGIWWPFPGRSPRGASPTRPGGRDMVRTDGRAHAPRAPLPTAVNRQRPPEPPAGRCGRRRRAVAGSVPRGRDPHELGGGHAPEDRVRDDGAAHHRLSGNEDFTRLLLRHGAHLNEVEPAGRPPCTRRCAAGTPPLPAAASLRR
ncbi:Ankyrin-2 [Gryllus bimaculatus]|nr:Ankyrin-2 [Gryllus bimaculatus]